MNFKTFYLFFFFSVSLLSAKEQQILFIGNSYTYCNGLPKTVQKMAELSGFKFSFRMEAPGGYRFDQHLKRKKTLEAIHLREWDAVFIQNQSFVPVESPRNMLFYGESLVKEIRKKSKRVILYQTMAYSGKQAWLLKMSGEKRGKYEKLYSEMFPRLEKSYNDLAKKVEAEVAPAGKAWQIAMGLQNDLVLHTGDKSHPNKLGSYLNALVFYGLIFNKQAKGFQLGPFEKKLEEKQPKLKHLRWLLEEAAWEAIELNRELLKQ